MRTTYEILPIQSCPIRVRKFINYNSKARIHWHDEIEIMYFTGGDGVLSCNLQEYNVKKGDIVFVNGKELHSGCVSGNDTAYYCFQVNTDFFHNLIGKEYVIFQNIFSDNECAALLDKIIKETQSDSFDSLIETKKLMYEFFALVGEKYVNTVLSEIEYKKQFKRLDTFNSVMEYLDAHFNEDLNVDALSKQFFMSPSYFAHMFKARANRSVIEYVNEIRVSHAKSLLEKESLAIGEIACRVGFNDINYFSRKFKAITGMTPSEYRKKCIENK